VISGKLYFSKLPYVSRETQKSYIQAFITAIDYSFTEFIITLMNSKDKSTPSVYEKFQKINFPLSNQHLPP